MWSNSAIIFLGEETCTKSERSFSGEQSLVPPIGDNWLKLFMGEDRKKYKKKKLYPLEILLYILNKTFL